MCAALSALHSLVTTWFGAQVAELFAAATQEKEKLRAGVSALKEEASAQTAAVTKADESSKVSQERYLRLNADFDNFRKRTVRAPLPPVSQGALKTHPICASSLLSATLSWGELPSLRHIDCDAALCNECLRNLPESIGVLIPLASVTGSFEPLSKESLHQQL